MHHGIPSKIVTDKDIRFMGSFWKTFHEMVGTSLLFSTTNHPQTDGQSERTIRTLNQLLRTYCQNDLANWDRSWTMRWVPCSVRKRFSADGEYLGPAEGAR